MDPLSLGRNDMTQGIRIQHITYVYAWYAYFYQILFVRFFFSSLLLDDSNYLSN